MTLDEAVNEHISRAQKFKQWYLKNHSKNPTDFPLELPEDNAGAWFEMMDEWVESS